ncbi:hypothetical protein SEA_PINKCOFFEE_79 [Gordonia phage PinkCoffee]|uniref:Uncharacterized protein n=1 Tax=Gordonia phage Danyall TaxID=2250390 RepID=A0A345KRA4_9CAUD|nr:hypothetical protein KNT95_gp78 [Gordonia phage Danyall]AXH45556.1 hypothetical protein SEA_DANYALL_78 [Gordonia phage Danyall]QZD98826.1 hypothetical protein SEA_PINKCOFFEE_79 [Gordonia phage PinkCoffee]
MIRRARGRHTFRHLGAAALPAPDLVAAKRGGYKIVDGDFVIDGRDPDEVQGPPPGWVKKHGTDYYEAPHFDHHNGLLRDANGSIVRIPDGPVGVFMNGRVHIAPATFDPPADSPFARMCRHLDDMQPTIRQLTQKA